MSHSLLKPRALKPGDRLAVVAPASPFDREEFEAGIEELRRLGFDPVYDESCSIAVAMSQARRWCGPPRCARPGPIRRLPA